MVPMMLAIVSGLLLPSGTSTGIFPQFTSTSTVERGIILQKTITNHLKHEKVFCSLIVRNNVNMQILHWLTFIEYSQNICNIFSKYCEQAAGWILHESTTVRDSSLGRPRHFTRFKIFYFSASTFLLVQIFYFSAPAFRFQFKFFSTEEKKFPWFIFSQFFSTEEEILFWKEWFVAAAGWLRQWGRGSARWHQGDFHIFHIGAHSFRRGQSVLLQ